MKGELRALSSQEWSKAWRNVEKVPLREIVNSDIEVFTREQFPKPAETGLGTAV